MTSQRHITPATEPETGAERPIPDRVLDATRASVLAVGVRRTTLTDVARRAGVSRMTLYRMVPDVTTLVLEVIAREFAAMLHDAEQRAGRRRSGRARIVATALEVVELLPSAPLFRRVIDVDPELLLPYLTDRLGTTQQLAVGRLRRMLAEGMADGSVRRTDAGRLAVTMVLTLTPFVVSARLLDEGDRRASLAELNR